MRPHPRPRALRTARARVRHRPRRHPTPRLPPSPILRDADLPPRRPRRRPRALLLHVLDLPGAADPLPRRPLRTARGPGGRRRPRAATRAGADCAAPRLRAHGMGGARLEHAVDPLLSPARRRLQKGVDPHAPHRRATAPSRAGPVVEERPDLARALRTLGVWGAMS